MKNTILTKEQFNEIIESRIEKIKATLYQKNKEYALFFIFSQKSRKNLLTFSIK